MKKKLHDWQIPKCAACAGELPEERRIEAFWKKTSRRESFCLVCFGEIFFNKLPKLSASSTTLPVFARRGIRSGKLMPNVRRKDGGWHHGNQKVTE